MLYIHILVATEGLYSHSLVEETGCKDNPLLKLINIPTLVDTLNDTPEIEDTNYCGLDTSCCSSKSYSVLFSHIETEVIAAKLNIFEQNSQFFKLIINEHKRNFVTFGIDDVSFNSLFSTYNDLVDELYILINKIFIESVKYQWDSYCQYICNPRAMDSCVVYNDTYYLNETFSYNYTYKCELATHRFSIIQEKIIEYSNTIVAINNTIDTIYNDIETKSNDTLTPTNITLLINSLIDGRYVSKSYSKNFVCKNDTSSCNSHIDNLCSIYSCNDDKFMKIYEDNAIISLEDGMVEVKYTNLRLNTTNQHDRDNTIDMIIEGYKLSSAAYYTNYILVLFIYCLFTY
jgi:hypothetical protein